MGRPVNLRKVFSAAAMVLVSASPALLAQWPAYPNAGIPKTADGKPDLTGRAPKTPDGHPDFSGIWRFVDSPNARPEPGLPPGVGSLGIGSPVPDCISSLISARRSRMVCRSNRGRGSCENSASRKKTKIIPMPTACRLV